MPVLTDKTPRKKIGIALRIDQATALREQAVIERHGNVSLIVQRAIDRELDRIAAEREQDGKSVAA